MTSVKAGKSESNTNAAEVLLLRRAADNDREAFDELFQNYHPRLFTFLFRLTRSHGSAEELANDVLLTLWKDAGRFRGESKVSTWVFGIAYRKALAHLRKRKLKLVTFIGHEAAGQDSNSVDLDGQFEREDWVRQGVENLPPKQQLTVMLVYFLGLSCEETAGVTGVPVSTVKTRMFHARRKMKQHLIASSVPQDWEEDNVNDTE
jgi:RNA polymerase sigma-70 factor (ECF subfamily)